MKRITKAQVLVDSERRKTAYRTIYQDKQGYFIRWRYQLWAVTKIRGQWVIA